MRQLAQKLLTGQAQPRAQRPHTMPIPQEGWLQARTLTLSEKEEFEQEQSVWAQGQTEKSQEGEGKTRDNRYRPTTDVLYLRYVKFLVWRTIVQNSCYVATGLGSQLYQFSPRHISAMTFGHFDEVDISHVKGKLLERIQKRFPSLLIDTVPPYGEKRVRLHTPSNDREQKLLLNALAAFMPLWLPRIPRSEPVHLVFRDDDPASDNAIEHREWKRMFAWIDASTLERLIGEYNKEVKDTVMRLKDPRENLGIPSFDPPSDNSSPLNPSNPGGGSPLDPDDLFTPSPLSDEALAAIQETLERNKRRRGQYRSGVLRVCIDGEEHGRLFPGATTSRTMSIAPDAAFLEIVGRDREGDLPLATFPLLGLEIVDDAPQRHRFIASMGEQRVELTLLPCYGEAGEVREYLASIMYTEKGRGDLWHWVASSGWRYATVAIAAAILPSGLALHKWRANVQLSTMLTQQQAEVQFFKDLAATKLVDTQLASMHGAAMHRLHELEVRLPAMLHGASFKTLSILGTALLYGQKWDKAMTAFARAQQLDPDNDGPYKALAAIYKLLGTHEASIQQLEALLQRRPHDAESLNFLGWSLYLEGRLVQARDAYTQALQLRGNNYPDALFNLSLLEEHEGREGEAQQLRAQARQLLEREITAHPQYAQAYFILAKIAAHEKTWGHAVSNLKKAVALEPELGWWARYETFFQEIFADSETIQPLREYIEAFEAHKIMLVLAQLSS
jgi:tetratricopeptide (TPR) repeat protein